MDTKLPCVEASSRVLILDLNMPSSPQVLYMYTQQKEEEEERNLQASSQVSKKKKSEIS